MFDFKQYKNNLACISSVGRQLTYGELDELAGRVCAHMEPHRLGFYLCSNTVGSVVGYVAFLRNSDAALLLDADMSRESFEDLMRVYRPGYIWAPAGMVLLALLAFWEAGGCSWGPAVPRDRRQKCIKMQAECKFVGRKV